MNEGECKISVDERSCPSAVRGDNLQTVLN